MSPLFRQDVLMKMLKQSPAANTLQTTPHVAMWRSELTVQLCIDLWLGMPFAENPWGHQDPSIVGFYQRPYFTENATSTQVLWSEEQLPSCEHLHAVRLVVKHLHYFANSLVDDSSAMDQLKKIVIPSSQRKVYYFIRQTMQHWPLDSSFKQILEIWLSYIQPWRYLDFRTRYNRVRTDPSPVDSRWLPFIVENLLVYSVIFHQLIDRFKMIDLASPKNAYMLFRLTKVLSQPNLSELLRQAEGNMGEMDSRGYSKWVQSHLVDLEGPAFQYQPIFHYNASIDACVRLAKQAENQAVRILDEEQRKNEQMSFWQRLFSAGISEKTLSEHKNMIIYLSASIKNLTELFQIPEDVVDNMTSFASTPTSSKPVNIHEMRPPDMKMRENNCKYEGDPDLHTICYFEIAFLVRYLYYICSWINYNYASELAELYSRRDVVGGVARQVLRGPLVVYYFDKRRRGSPVRVSYTLPPRMSLRPLANCYVLGYGSLLILLLMTLFSLSFTTVTGLTLFLWVMFMVFRWMLGNAPPLPEVNVHNVSDSGVNW